MKAYKVVYSGPESDNQLVSAFTKNVLYIPGQETFPITDFSRLFCFDNLQNAVDWLFTREDFVNELQIWECEVDGVERNARDFFVSPWLTNIRDFLQGFDYEPPYSDKGLPKGTLAVKSIKLTKQVSLLEITGMRIY